MTVFEWLSTDRAQVKRALPEFDSGVVVFCGIGLLLSLASMLFGWLGLAGTAGF
jgi:hypothetical protein